MYSVNVRGHIMIAHSFRGELFGPAQRLHGATYVVDVEFRRPALGPDGVVVDIGRASETLSQLLRELDFKNLDDDPAFAGKNTTTEFMAGVIFERMTAAIYEDKLAADGRAIVSMRVTLHESHVAWAAFEAPLTKPSR